MPWPRFGTWSVGINYLELRNVMCNLLSKFKCQHKVTYCYFGPILWTWPVIGQLSVGWAFLWFYVFAKYQEALNKTVFECPATTAMFTILNLYLPIYLCHYNLATEQ